MGDRAFINQSYGGRQSLLDGEAIQSAMGAVQGNAGYPALAALQRMKSARTNAQGVPIVMDVGDRPTITSYTSADTSISVNYALTYNTNRDKIYSGGGKLVDYSGGGLFGASVSTGSNLNAGQYQEAVFHEVETASPIIEFRIFRQSTTRCRILSRASSSAPWKYAHTGLITMDTTAAGTSVKVAYASPLAGRQTRIEFAAYTGDGGTASILTAFRVSSGYTAAAPSIRTAPNKICVLADSFGQGGNALFAGDGFAQLLGWQLNAEVTNSGIGGTGLIANTGGTQLALTARLDDAIQQDFTAFIPAMGTNDVSPNISVQPSDITAAANAVIAGLQARNPLAPQFWITPWDLEAPSALASNKAVVRDAIKAATAGKSGVYTLDPTGVVFTQTSLHPDTAGHLTLSNWVSGQIASILATI